jgi:hypothetical protein
MLRKEVAKRMLSNLLEIISDFSDKDYQKKAWLYGELPGTDFDETVCQFIDIGDPILDNYKDCEINNSQYQILKKFRYKIGVFAEENSWPPKFIDTPEWNEITEMAKEVLKAFHYS